MKVRLEMGDGWATGLVKASTVDEPDPYVAYYHPRRLLDIEALVVEHETAQLTQ